MNKFIFSYAKFLVIFHAILMMLVFVSHYGFSTLEVSRAAIASNGIIYMMVLFMPITNSRMTRLQVFLVSMPILVVLLTVRHMISTLVVGFEPYSYSLVNMKMANEAIVSVMVQIIAAAIAYAGVSYKDGVFTFFRIRNK